MNKIIKISSWLYVALIASFNLHAQYTFDWAVTSGGTLSDDTPSDFCIDNSNNIISTGYFGPSADFDPGAGIYTLTSNGGNDIYIQKLDPNGNLLWAKKVGGIGNEYSGRVTTDASGNIYVCGRFTETADFGSGIFMSATLTSGTCPTDTEDGFIMKIDPAGNTLWAAAFCGPSYDNTRSIDVDAAGNVYASGTYYDNCDFNYGTGTAILSTGSINYGYFIVKYTGSGSFLWAQNLIPNGVIDSPDMMMVDNNNDIVFAQRIDGTMDVDPGPALQNLIAPTYGLFIEKLDSSGNFIWAKLFQETTISEFDMDDLNNIYVTGNFNLTQDFDPGAGIHNITAAGNEDIFVMKLDSGGNLIWVNTTGSTADWEFSVTIDVDDQYNVYTCGIFGLFGPTIDIDPGAGTTTLTTMGNTDIYARKMDSGGNYLWSFVLGGSSPDYGGGILVDNNYDVIVGGTISSTGNYNPLGSYVLNTTGINDQFLMKMNQTTNGINTIANLDNDLVVYPNPSTGIFNLQVKNKTEANVFDVSGKIVLNKTLLTGTNCIDLRDVNNGIYTLAYFDDKTAKTILLIKN